MANQALYLKWRPQGFEDVIGQDHITQTLRGALRQGRIRHAYLFSGPRGTGKTTNARLLAKALNCLDDDPNARPCNICENCVAFNEGRFFDVIEIDAASHTGVDDVRDLRDKIAFMPNHGRYKIYIIDEVHRFSGAAFDALLKTLEEPPDHAIFILATTEFDKVPATIKSRCLMFEFRRVSIREVMERLALICDSEGIQIDEGALELVARYGTGSVRDSISLLDQIVADPSEPVTYALAQAVLGAAGSEKVFEIAQAIIENNPALGLDVLNDAIDNGADPRQLGQQLVDHLRQLLLIRVGNRELVDASNERRERLAQQATLIGRSALLRAIRAFNAALHDIRAGWQPQLPLELALVESTKPIQEEEVVMVQRVVQSTISATVTPQPTATAPVEEAGAISLSEFIAGWDKLKKTAYQINKTIPALLEWCEPYRVVGRNLIFGLKSPVLKSKLEKQETMHQLQQAATYVYGSGFHVKIELVDENAKAGGEIAERIAKDDFLARAMNELGAEIDYTEDESS